MDNSAGKPFVEAADVREPLGDYAKDYGGLLAAICEGGGAALGPGQLGRRLRRADPVIRQNPAYLEEFAIRPLSHNYLHFEDLAATVEPPGRLTAPRAAGGAGRLPGGRRPDRRADAAGTLACYYLLADPECDISDVLRRPRAGHDLAAALVPGRRLRRRQAGGAVVAPFVEGDDPANPAMEYRVYRRTYERAVVLFKPLSHKPGDWKVRPTLGDGRRRRRTTCGGRTGRCGRRRHAGRGVTGSAGRRGRSWSSTQGETRRQGITANTLKTRKKGRKADVAAGERGECLPAFSCFSCLRGFVVIPLQDRRGSQELIAALRADPSDHPPDRGAAHAAA